MLKDTVQLTDVKPVICSYIREARIMLDPGKKPDENAVHDVRVLMKKSRASVRLLKFQLDEDAFKKEYSAFREVGRIMRLWRETSVHRKLLKYLRKKYPDLFENLNNFPKIKLLLNKQEESDMTSPEMKEDIGEIITILHKSEFRWRFMSIKNPDKDLFLKGLEGTYKNVADCFLRARNYPKSINVHEFRKTTKDFLYQLFFFRSLRPKLIRDLEKELDLIAQNLGKYNDYSVLIDALEYKYPQTERNDAVDELVVLIRKEQDRYLSRTWPAAYKIFRPGLTLYRLLKIKTDAN